MSTFSGLNAATTALWTQRRALDVTGQNIANVNTDGYSRQRADMQAIGGSPVPAFYSTSSGIGAGVSADSITRIRDAFLEGRGHTEHANIARLTAESEAYLQVEAAFREPGDTGIQSLMGEMWSAWGDVDNGPHELSTRGAVLEKLQTLVGGLQFSHASMGTQWKQTRENLSVLVDDVNKAAESVAKLNQAIQRATQSGLPANDLTDQRDLLIMKLSDQVGAVVRPADDGMLDVVVGGMALVTGNTASALALAGTLSPDTVAADPPRLVTASGGFTVRPGGTAAGHLNTLKVIIPDARAELDAFANNLATALNTAHGAGYDLDGNIGTPILGPSSGPLTASSISVLITDRRKIAASAVAPVARRAGAGQQQRRRDRPAAPVRDRPRRLVPGDDHPARRPVRGDPAEPGHPAGHHHPGRRGPGVRGRCEPRRGDDQHAVLPTRLLGRRTARHRHRRDARRPDQPHRTRGALT